MNEMDEMRDDYSDVFEAARANGTLIRGKYYERAMREKQLVRIDEDVLAAFPTALELNAALRGIIEVSRHVHRDGT